MKKLLFITNNPERASFRQRVGVYLDTLKQGGIEPQVETLPKGLNARFKLFRQAKNFDGVFLHKKGLNPLDAYFLCKYAKKVIYNYDDAVMCSDKSPHRYSGSHYRPWKRSVESADLVIVASSYLAHLGKKYNSNVEILPIGLKVDDYKAPPDVKRDDKIRLVWIGSKSTLVYLKGIAPDLEEIGRKYDNVILRIISDDFFDLTNMPVEKRPWSQKSRALDLAECDIGLAPLPDNPFTWGKCSFKVLEYAAAGLPVVASPVGTNADHIIDSVTGFLVNNKLQWLDVAGKLIIDSSLRKQMGQKAAERARDFDVGVIGAAFTKLLFNCLAKTDKS